MLQTIAGESCADETRNAEIGTARRTIFKRAKWLTVCETWRSEDRKECEVELGRNLQHVYRVR